MNQMTPIKPMLLSDRDVAALLGMSKSSVWSWTKQGKLPQPVKMGSFTRWRREEIEEFVNQLAH